MTTMDVYNEQMEKTDYATEDNFKEPLSPQAMNKECANKLNFKRWLLENKKEGRQDSLGDP